MRHQFDGLIAEVYDWGCLTPIVFLKESVKADMAEKEMVMAYLRWCVSVKYVCRFYMAGGFAERNRGCGFRVTLKNNILIKVEKISLL